MLCLIFITLAVFGILVVFGVCLLDEVHFGSIRVGSALGMTAAFSFGWLVALTIVLGIIGFLISPLGEDFETEHKTYSVSAVIHEGKKYKVWFDQDEDGNTEEHSYRADNLTISQSDTPSVTAYSTYNPISGIGAAHAELFLPEGYMITGDES